ncbi:MAG: Bro-N domain-containing protein [Bacteroidales bacterium]|nr:Bro-N domain-containing protein [Bacteroidales bacterium]
MTQKQAIQLFEQKKVRTVWDTEKEKWYFSVVDVVAVLTDSPNPRNYWKVLKHRLIKEGNESVTNCNQLKMQSSDGKRYLTDVADTEQLFRLIQSIPSPKAEPVKQWMAQVAATTTQISKNENPKGMAESAGIARRGGAVANDARKAVEKETGQPVVSTMNAKQIAQGEGELLLEDGEE